MANADVLSIGLALCDMDELARWYRAIARMKLTIRGSALARRAVSDGKILCKFSLKLSLEISRHLGRK